jgi:hypothetical protein
MDFKIKGKKSKHKFWSWIFKMAQKKVKESEEKVVNVISVTFPSAFCMLIRYEIINEGKKYEIVTQGDYQEVYKKWKESEETEVSETINVEALIVDQHQKSKQVAIKRQNQ